MKKAFIFDFDGTLMDSMKVWEHLGEDYLALKKVSNIPCNLKELLKPMSLLDAAIYFSSTFNLKEMPEKICEEINTFIESNYRDQVQPKEGVPEFLEQYKDHPMCIATATEKHLVEITLDRLGLSSYFQFILTSKEVGNSKTSPDIYLTAARLLKKEISDCIVFEDALHAIKSAKSAGFYTVGIYERFCEDDLIELKSNADQFVYQINDFIKGRKPR